MSSFGRSRSIKPCPPGTPQASSTNRRQRVNVRAMFPSMRPTMPSLSIPSPIGDLTIEEQGDAIVAINWANRPAGNGSPLLAEAARQLQAYFDGKLSHFDLPLAPAGSPFEKRVWSAMQKIPYGETRCYGDLAADIDSAPRPVGRACGHNPIPIVIPCHRVLAKGGLGGYSGAGGLDTKQALLRLEGAHLPGR